LFIGTQQRVLGLLFGQPTRSYYANELIGMAGAGSGAVQRELARLTRSGLLTVRPVGNQKHYQANPDSPLFAELCGIAQKTVGLAVPLREALMPLAPQIQAAFVYGSVAKRQDTVASDIDLMLISDTLTHSDTQLLPSALGLGPEVWRVLSKRHDIRNLGEYEGDLNVDERIVTDLIAACHVLPPRLVHCRR
jgi:predicted nucleotidyltransferase